MVVASFGFYRSLFFLPSSLLCFVCAFKEDLGRPHIHTYTTGVFKWLLILPAWLIRHFALLEITVTVFLILFWWITKYRNFLGSERLWLLLARGLFQCLDHSSVCEGPFEQPTELSFSSARKQRSDIRSYETLRNAPIHTLTYEYFSSLIFAG